MIICYIIYNVICQYDKFMYRCGMSSVKEKQKTEKIYFAECLFHLATHEKPAGPVYLLLIFVIFSYYFFHIISYKCLKKCINIWLFEIKGVKIAVIIRRYKYKIKIRVFLVARISSHFHITYQNDKN